MTNYNNNATTNAKIKLINHSETTNSVKKHDTRKKPTMNGEQREKMKKKK